MTYPNLGYLRDGDIILTRARRCLRWLCDYDHAALVWSRPDGDGHWWYTIEAGFTGVRAWRFGEWGRPFVVLRPVCADFVSQDAVSMALRWLGDPYAIWHLPAVIHRMWAKRTQRVEVFTQARVCTELVIDAYRLVGVDLTPGVDHPSPDDIAGSARVEVVDA